jgi:hypothetical protein
VILVEMVIAGAVLAVATVPAKPFADTTEAVVTVPFFPSCTKSVPSHAAKTYVPVRIVKPVVAAPFRTTEALD